MGARGGVATTAILGLCGLKKGLVGQTGLISGLEPFATLKPVDWGDFLVGGHEIRDIPLAGEAARLASERAVDAKLVADCEAELGEIDERIRPGTIFNVGSTIQGMAEPQVPRNESPRQAIARLQADLREFAESGLLDHVIVVNVTSTEPAVDPATIPATWAELDKTLDSMEKMPPARQFIICNRGHGSGLFLYQLHALSGLGSGGYRRACPSA